MYNIYFIVLGIFYSKLESNVPFARFFPIGLEPKFDRLKEGKTIICTIFFKWKKDESEKASF